MTPHTKIVLHLPSTWDPAKVAGWLTQEGRDVVLAPTVEDLARERAPDRLALCVLGLAPGVDANPALAAVATAPNTLVLHEEGHPPEASTLQRSGMRAVMPFVAAQPGPLLRAVEAILETSQLRHQLAQSEAQYSDLLHNTRDAIYILGPAQFVFVNRAFTDLLGYAAHEICNPAFDYMQLIAPESRPMIMERGRLAALGEPLPPRYEFTALNKAGQRLDVSVSVSYIVYSGRASSLGVLQDITARKQYEKALLRRNRELAVLNDLAATVSRAPDLNTVLETAVERLIAVMGFSSAGISLLQPANEGVKARLYRGLNGAQRALLQGPDMWDAMVGAAMRTGEVQVVQHHGQGHNAPAVGLAALGFKSAVCVPIQARDCVLGTAVGLCAEPREFAPEELSLLLSIGHQLGTAVERATLFDNQEAALQRLLAMDELARALSSTLNQEEVFHVAGQQLQRVLHATTVEMCLLRGPDDLEVVLRADGVQWHAAGLRLPRGEGLQWKALLARHPEVFSAQEDARGHWGAHTVNWVAASPLLLEEKPVGCVLVGFSGERAAAEEAQEFLGSVSAHLALASKNARMFSDLDRAYHELKEAKDRLVLQEKLSALGEMSAGVAHDFNNVLGAILGRAQLLKAFIQDPALQKSLEVIERAALDGAATVRRIQEFSRVGGEEELQPVDLDEATAAAADFTLSRWKNRAPHQTVEVVVEKGAPPRVRGNAQQLREVLVNLIINACDAMPTGGHITLSTGVKDARAFVLVKDTGTGIPAEVRGRIFDPFFTTKGVQGTGLGLSVSYGIMQRHRGDIEVQSEMGRGTTFTLWLPLVDETVPAMKPVGLGKGAVVAPHVRARVLVIDDEESIRDVLADMLRAADHAVEVAHDGPSALFVLDRLVKEGLDVVFTDLGMPGMSGWEVASTVKQRHPHLPVGLITGWGASLDADKMKVHGVDLVVPKPFKFEQVTSVVAEALALARSRRST